MWGETAALVCPRYSKDTLTEFRAVHSWLVFAGVLLIAGILIRKLLSVHVWLVVSLVDTVVVVVMYLRTVHHCRNSRKFALLARKRDSSHSRVIAGLLLL